jgi:hypothetical protein
MPATSTPSWTTDPSPPATTHAITVSQPDATAQLILEAAAVTVPA